MPAKRTTGDIEFEVEKFDGRNNFCLWQMRMKSILIQQGIKVALSGKEKKPTKINDDDWVDIDERALSTIQLYLSDEVLYNVRKETTAKSLWEKIETLYMGKSLSNKLHLKKQLYRLKLDEGYDVLEHMNTFNKMIIDLLKLDVKLDDEDKSLLFLSSLPDSYDHFVTTLLCGKETIKFEEVTQAIISNAAMKKSTRNDSHTKGLLVKGGSSDRGRTKENGKARRNNSRSKSRSKNDSECFFCGKKGHWKRDCWKYRAKNMDGKKAQKDGLANVTSRSEVELISVSQSTLLYDAWILDSGCSYHMCPNRDLFYTYESYNGVNDAPCKVIGIGTIKIKMFDGVVRTLRDVRHVPALKKNLISLGMLESKGCTFSAKDGAFKVSKGTLVVIKGTRLDNNLYKLQGDTVSGGAIVSIYENISADES